MDDRQAPSTLEQPDVDPFAFGHASFGRSVVWQVGSRLLVQVMGLAIQIVLARALAPEDFGVVAVTLAVVNTLLLVVQGGFNVVVTQRPNLTAPQLSTLWWMSLGTAAVLMFGLWFVSPAIAGVYDDPRLVGLLRGASALLAIGAFTNIQAALAMRRFLFKQLFWASAVGTAVSGAVAVALVSMGVGAWVIVLQAILNQLFTAVAMFARVRWLPALEWAPREAAVLLKQGLHLLLPSLLYSSFTGGVSLVVGWLYGPTVLGFYDRGRQFPEYLFGSLNLAVQSVALPAMARHQHDADRVAQVARAVLRTSCMLVFPGAIGFALVAPDLIPFVLGSSWAPAVPYLQLSALFFLHIPISHTNQRAMIAVGRTDLTVKLNVFEVAVGVALVAAGAAIGGPVGLAAGLAISGGVNVLIFTLPNKSLISYGFLRQARDLLPVVAATCLMALVVLSIAELSRHFPALPSIAFQVLAGAITYAAAGLGLGFLRRSEIAVLARGGA